MEIPAVRERDYRAEIKQGLVAIDLQGRQLRLAADKTLSIAYKSVTSELDPC